MGRFKIMGRFEVPEAFRIRMTDQDLPAPDGSNGDRRHARRGGLEPAAPWIEGRVGRHRRLSREDRRLRLRRRGKRAYIRSVYFLPSLCTLGNAVCGFAAMYVAFLAASPPRTWNRRRGFSAAAYLIFLAMVFDALDGRLARFARHTTDFGGQLDSLADVISFGAAPAFLTLLLFKQEGPQDLPRVVGRAVWAVGALYMSCAALRLARFNVSNEHGEQHHFSFLGLPSPGAAGAVAALILMQQELGVQGAASPTTPRSTPWPAPCRSCRRRASCSCRSWCSRPAC